MKDDITFKAFFSKAGHEKYLKDFLTSIIGYELNNLVSYYYIELSKFRKRNPDMTKKLNCWLAFLYMERKDLLEMAIRQIKEITGLSEEEIEEIESNGTVERKK